VSFDIAAIGDRHDRSAFACGHAALDNYLKALATQDVRRRISACYVACAAGSDAVVGYYTLSAASVLLDALPPEWIKRLPRYPSIPAVRIGRLAVDQRCQGQGLGGALLADGIARAMRSEMACHAAIVEAKDDGAVRFYRHHGFMPSASSPRTLFLPLANVRGLLGR
jgi:ribosomal protein S18 acetylase RimI-like enzyme